MSPGFPASHEALAHFARREIRTALELFGRALEQGEDPRVHVNERWACWMLLGEFERAWQESDQVGGSFAPDVLGAEHILIRCLRGFGDAVQFLRFLPALKSKCRRVSIQAPERLLPLLRTLPDVERVFAFEDPGALRCDGFLECSDLPYLLRVSLDSIPRPLQLPGRPVRRTVANGRVGLARKAGDWNPARTIPMRSLDRVLKSAPGDFVSLDLETEGWDFCTEARCRGGTGLLDTIGLISQLDLVITVDTLIAHLAGSLGVPTWTLLPYSGDWRWMLEREDCPWYPAMRLFRQEKPDDWEPVIERVSGELARLRTETSH